MFEIGERLWCTGARRYCTVMSLFYDNERMFACVKYENYIAHAIVSVSQLTKHATRNVNVEVFAFLVGGKLQASCVQPDQIPTAKTSIVVQVAV